jgi:hypothetical protein
MAVPKESLPLPRERFENFTPSEGQIFMGDCTYPNSPEPQIRMSCSTVRAAEKLPALTFTILKRSSD